MSRAALPALCLCASLGGLAVLGASFITVSGPVSENVTDASPGGGTAPVPAAPTLASSSASGAVGATFTARGHGTAYRIKLSKVTQQATLDPYESLTTAGDHVAAAEFAVTGETGQAGDDPDLAAVAAGSDGTVYLPAGKDLAEGAGFQGQFTIGPRQTQTGWVTFEVPVGVTVTCVQWRPAVGTGAVTWPVDGGNCPAARR